MMAKISKESAQRAKDKAREEKQGIMRDAGKRLTTAQRARMNDLNKVIDAANEIINEEE
jgi:hypothetical protein